MALKVLYFRQTHGEGEYIVFLAEDDDTPETALGTIGYELADTGVLETDGPDSDWPCGYTMQKRD